MLDIQTWIERTFASWDYRLLGSAILLVIFTAAVSQVWLIERNDRVHLVAGATKPVAVKRWLDRDDPRGFLPPSALGNPTKADGRFDIAWVSGSPIYIRTPQVQWRLLGKTWYNMTDVLARYLASLDGKPVRVQEFLLQGTRTGDKRRAVLFAANQPEIDAYLVVVNAFWIANDFLQFTHSRQRANILGLTDATWFDYRVALKLLTPHEIGLQILSSFLPVVRDRYRIFRHISFGHSAPFPFTKKLPPVEDTTMLRNWMRWFFPDLSKLPISKKAATLKSARNVLLMGDLDSRSPGIRFFEEDVKTLSRTGKPAIIYLAPLNPVLRDDPAAVAYLNRLVEVLKSVFAKSAHSNVELHTETLWEEPQPIRHRDRDVIHLDNGQGIIDMATELLERKLGKEFKRRPLYQVYKPAWPVSK